MFRDGLVATVVVKIRGKQEDTDGKTISKQDLFLDHDDPQPDPPFAVKIRLIIPQKPTLIH